MLSLSVSLKSSMDESWDSNSVKVWVDFRLKALLTKITGEPVCLFMHVVLVPSAENLRYLCSKISSAISYFIITLHYLQSTLGTIPAGALISTENCECETHFLQFD